MQQLKTHFMQSRSVQLMHRADLSQISSFGTQKGKKINLKEKK